MRFIISIFAPSIRHGAHVFVANIVRDTIYDLNVVFVCKAELYFYYA